MAHYRNAVWQVIIKEYFQAKIGRDKTVLDLGSGWAEFINNIQAKTKYAMDLNPESRTKAAADVIFIQQDCSQTWDLPDNSLDVVFTSNFFEHLPTKRCLLETLREAHRCLKPSGKIICLGPNIRYIGYAYWDFYDHYIQLSHLSLIEALKLVDFKIASAIPKFLPYTMADGKRHPLVFVKLYLKLPIFWPLLGKQFLITAEK